MHLKLKDNGITKLKNFLTINNKFLKGDNIFISGYKGKVTLFTQTFHSYIKTEINDDSMKISKEGEVVLDSKIITNLIFSSNEGTQIEIYKAKSNFVQIFSEFYECDLVLTNNVFLDPSRIEVDFKEGTFQIPYYILRDSYSRLKDFLKSFEQTVIVNRALTDIFFRKKPDSQNLEVWASDSYRTIFGEFKLDTDISFEMSINPSTLFSIISFYADYEDESINFHLDNTNKYLTCFKDGCIIKTKLRDTKYPDFMSAFQLEKNITFEVDRLELLKVIDRNLSFSEREWKTTLYRIENDKLFIEHRDGMKGRYKAVLNINNNEKVRNFEFHLNNNLLRGLVKTMNSKGVIFNICDSLKPIVLTSEEKSEFKQFILPSRNF